jgi:hypothetical protein
MSDERYASVWDAIENTPAEAENLKLFALNSVTRFSMRRFMDIGAGNASSGSNESDAGAAANSRDA